MPKLKQPVPLQEMALNVLLNYVLDYCNEHNGERSCAGLRRAITMVKNHIFIYIPWHLLADFTSKFLETFQSKDHPANHNKAALEMVLDTDFVGLRCKGPIFAHITTADAKRLRGLEELDLSFFPHIVCMNLENFHLGDLVTFIFPKHCTNYHLMVIGSNCPKLQVLKIRSSEVTDEGLRALSPCSELRVVDIFECSISDDAINNLLSIHEKIEELVQWNGVACSGICTSITRIDFRHNRDDYVVRLKDVMAKFPNLTYLKMDIMQKEDLSILKSLEKLTEIEIHFEYEIYVGDVEYMWNSLKVLFAFTGSKITTLKLSCWDIGYFWEQNHLNIIFQSCPNLDYLGFDQGGGLVVIPPFQKLKVLIPRIPIEFEQIEILEDPALEFRNLPSLETLSVFNYGMKCETLASMMLDDETFPNLSVIKTNCLTPEDLAELDHIVRSNNLDIKIENDTESNWYIKYRFGSSSDTDDSEDTD